MIYEHLNYGEKNGISIEDLKIPSGISDGRKLWRQITFERSMGFPIFKTPDKKFYLLERSGLNKRRALIRKQIRETIKKIKQLPVPVRQEETAAYSKKEKELYKVLRQLECEESHVNKCLTCNKPRIEESSLSRSEQLKHEQIGIYSRSWQQSDPTPR